jgi:lambda repressor-like predicted transcriptional regulator
MLGFQQFFESNQIENQVIVDYLSKPGVSVGEIGKNHGLSEREVYRILRFNQVSPNRKGMHVEKVKHLAGMGWGIREIAGFTGYSTRNVRNILNKQLRENDLNQR